MNLFNAAEEFLKRPADERFESLKLLLSYIEQRSFCSHEELKNTKNMICKANGHLYLESQSRQKYKLNNWSFSQLCTYLNIPKNFIQRLPKNLASENIQYFLDKTQLWKDEESLFLCNPIKDECSMTVRSITSSKYGRIWDINIVEAVKKLVEDNPAWHVPPACNKGAGLYASDRDLFIFMVDETNKVEWNSRFMGRGFFVWNSEVGSKSFGLMTFIYDYVCQNHIVLNAENVTSFEFKHTRGAPEKLANEIRPALQKMLIDVPIQVEMFDEALKSQIGNTKDDFVKYLVSKNFTKTEATQAHDYALREEGRTNTRWHAIQGLTAYARDMSYANNRVDLEIRAGSLLSSKN